jgi:predicted dehydrogenase
MKKFKAAVIGGGSGGRLSLNALSDSDRFDLVAVADFSAEARAKLANDYNGIKTFASAEELFAACELDLVCVSTWAPSHEEITLAALKLPLAGIVVEKPLGHTAASGRRILEAVKAKGIPMATPHNLMVNETPLDVMRRLRAGEIGKLKLVEIQCGKWDIINAGIHWINLFVNLVGLEPVDYVMALCEGSARTFRDGMQVETTSITYIQTRSGVRGIMQCGDDVIPNDGSGRTLFRLVGEKGMIEFHAWANGFRILNAAHPDFPRFEVPALPFAGHRAQLENLAKMIDTGKKDYAIPESSLTALEICEAAYLSSKHGCRVDFPYETFTVPPRSDWEMGIPYPGHGGGRDGRKL